MVDEEQADHLPAWSMRADGAPRERLPADWPHAVTREWAWGGSSGAGVRVAIVDSGIDGSHPQVGGIASAHVVEADPDGEPSVVPDELGDVAGHGTACAGIIRSLAPDAELHSVRVLGPQATGRGAILLAGLRWAVRQRFDVINLSLSTRKPHVAAALHEIADEAWFRRVALVASAHNMAVDSWPWRFASVISVGSHDATDPLELHANPEPPVEFFARGVDLRVAWLGGGTTVSTGNSFATPHVAAVAALVLAKHPLLTPAQLKTVLFLTASNVGAAGA
jgi:subtilisin family serine protease